MLTVSVNTNGLWINYLGGSMKKRIKRFEAALLSMAILFLTFSGDMVMAADTETQKTTFPVHVIHKTGDDKENFVIVIMGDGYTAEQQDQFLEDVKRKAQGMLSWSPYKEYSDRINIYAVQVVSNESGISEYRGKSVDTYFHVKAVGKAPGFTGDGAEKARKIRTELEDDYLDHGANVGTIHIISNDEGYYGASVNPLFSFSANCSENLDGSIMAHEMSHSIGRLGDEYGRYTNTPNTSDTSDPDMIKWNKLLGFRGIGITMAGTDTAFAPSRKCMMRWLDQPFCEVCKMELVRRLNSTDYIRNPQALYLADPEITISHNRTGTLDTDSEKYRISEKNITKANEESLEFRTVVQNMVDREQHLKMSFQILGEDGVTVKYKTEKEYTIPALTNTYDPDAARESLSVVLPVVYGLSGGDRLDGKIIDMDTQEVLATDKTSRQTWNTVNIHYECRNEDGTNSAIPDTTPAIVYVPEDSTYILRKPELSGYTCVGSSIDQEQIKITEDGTDITYYYEKNNDSSGDSDQKIAECTTNPVCVTYDEKPHTFDITPGEGVKMRYRLTEDAPYTLTELPAYTDAGNYTIYYEASSDAAKTSYGQASLEIMKAATDLKLVPAAENLEGGGKVGLQLIRQGIPEKEKVNMVCDSSKITLTEMQDDRWEVILPNETKTYVFTAYYGGDDNYKESKADCQVAVTKKEDQSGGTTGGTTEETPGGTIGEKPEETPGGTTGGTTEETPGEPNQVETLSGKIILLRPKVKKNTSNVENINTTLKKAVIEADQQAKNSSIRIKCNARKRKKLIFKLERSTIKLLVKKEVKELQFDSGNLRITMDRKTLKEIEKRISADVYLEIRKADKDILSRRAKKLVGKHTIYEFKIRGAKKKQISRLKKGKITIEIPYRSSEIENSKQPFAYAINKKGNIVKQKKSSYDAKKKAIKFTTSQLSKVLTGY